MNAPAIPTGAVALAALRPLDLLLGDGWEPCGPPDAWAVRCWSVCHVPSHRSPERSCRRPDRPSCCPSSCPGSRDLARLKLQLHNTRPARFPQQGAMRRGRPLVWQLTGSGTKRVRGPSRGCLTNSLCGQRSFWEPGALGRSCSRRASVKRRGDHSCDRVRFLPATGRVVPHRKVVPCGIADPPTILILIIAVLRTKRSQRDARPMPRSRSRWQCSCL